METVADTKQVGAIVHRVREDLGLSRADLSARSGVGARTIFALENGEQDNIGFANCLRILNALGLKLSIGTDGTDPTVQQSAWAPAGSSREWNDLGDLWKLGEE